MPDDIWYREYLAVATKLDAVTQERDDMRSQLDAESGWKRANVELAEQAVALRAELAAAKNDERRNWVKALLEVLPEEKAVLFREICVARDKLEKIKGGEDE